MRGHRYARDVRARVAIVCLVTCVACGGGDTSPASDGGAASDGVLDTSDAAPDASATATGIAPANAIDGERQTSAAMVDVDVAMTRPVVTRIEVAPNEHVTFFLSFAPSGADVELEVLRWNGETAVSLGTTDAGGGIRTLAVFDPSERRTFWARITTRESAALAATLAITRVPFEDGARCTADCAHLLQLPLANDTARDGYAATSDTVFRYQYGRRDLVMLIRHAGQRVAALGMQPFVPHDLSQWDGETPGSDVGSLRHASHQRGKDADISLYGLDGRSTWRSFCTVMPVSGGRECTPGTIHDYDGDANAVFFGDFFASGRVATCFLDRELHATTIASANAAATRGALEASLVPLYSDGVHLAHWPNHDNHIHIRVSEEAVRSSRGSMSTTPVEPP